LAGSSAPLDREVEMLTVAKLGAGQENYYLEYADPRVMPTSLPEVASRAENETMVSA
jgi:hypothetical protein